MKGKVTLGVGIVLLIITLIACFGLFRSYIAVASRYTELDRAGCINEVALKAQSEGRFQADNRQSVANWIGQPAFETATFTLSVLAVAAIANVMLGIALVRGK